MMVYIVYAHSKTWNEILGVFDSYDKALKSKKELQGPVTGSSSEVFFIIEREVF